MAKIYNLNIDAGATYTISFVYKNSESVPFDLTDYSVQCQFRTKDDTVKVSPTMTKEDLDGVVTLSLTAVQTSTLTDGPYDYAIELHGDDVIRMIQGTVAVSPEVVR